MADSVVERYSRGPKIRRFDHSDASALSRVQHHRLDRQSNLNSSMSASSRQMGRRASLSYYSLLRFLLLNASVRQVRYSTTCRGNRSLLSTSMQTDPLPSYSHCPDIVNRGSRPDGSADTSRLLGTYHRVDWCVGKASLVDCKFLLQFIHRGAESSDQRRGHVERAPRLRRRLRRA